MTDISENAPNSGNFPPAAQPQPAMRRAARPRKFKTPRTILALIMREMQTTYGRNVGGYVWALVEPIGGITFLVVIFSIGLRIKEPSLGNNFALFYTTGMMPLAAFLTCANKVSHALNYSRPLLSYPGVQYSDALVARFLLAALTQMIVAMILFAAIHVIWSVETILDAPAVVMGMALMAFCGFGIGVLNCYFFAVFPLWLSVWNILTRPLFIFSTVIFTFEEVPRAFRDELWWNPIVHGVGIVRSGFYATYDANWISVIYPVLLGLVTMTLGLAFLHRYHGDILNR